MYHNVSQYITWPTCYNRIFRFQITSYYHPVISNHIPIHHVVRTTFHDYFVIIRMTSFDSLEIHTYDFRLHRMVFQKYHNKQHIISYIIFVGSNNNGRWIKEATLHCQILAGGIITSMQIGHSNSFLAESTITGTSPKNESHEMALKKRLLSHVGSGVYR